LKGSLSRQSLATMVGATRYLRKQAQNKLENSPKKNKLALCYKIRRKIVQKCKILQAEPQLAGYSTPVRTVHFCVVLQSCTIVVQHNAALNSSHIHHNADYVSNEGRRIYCKTLYGMGDLNLGFRRLTYL